MFVLCTGRTSGRAGRCRKMVFSSKTVETVTVLLPCQKTKLKLVKRDTYNLMEEGSTYDSTFSGVPFRPTKELPLVELTDKACVLGGAAVPDTPEDWADRKSTTAVPLFWQESKPIAFWRTLLRVFKISKVFDTTPGSGALMEACLAEGCFYHGLCLTAAHMTWLANVADRAAAGLIGEDGSPLYSKDLALLLKSHYQTVLDALAAGDAEDASIESDAECE
ncbi:unnamed protein product [Polarella glacialis]|uniref:Uncharacterized protein n=1 Tax=Polarella glacialis TaxID=89957 RepID=A0A813FUB2_POLGL|nr:unnamed protein product [Polarella glacialis]